MIICQKCAVINMTCCILPAFQKVWLPTNSERIFHGNGFILKPLVVELMSFDTAMASRGGAAGDHCEGRQRSLAVSMLDSGGDGWLHCE